jgi:hypothetical protein
MWAPEYSDDPKKKEKKYAGASEGFSGALAGGGGLGGLVGKGGAGGGGIDGSGVLVAEKIGSDEIKEVASTRKADKKPAVRAGKKTILKSPAP